MKKKRTTIYLNESVRNLIKQYQLNHDKTMTEIIEMGIKSLIKEEQIKPINRQPISVGHNKFAMKIFNELEKYVTPTIARSIMDEICHSHHIKFDELNPRTLTMDIISDISRIVAAFSKDGNMTVIENRLIHITKGGG